ncbi:BrnA antitoxin family protein [Lentilitoribacter sp. EG35]|uniref:BrnA antitoxin family protein n=1 Tax=Lentilitoribacter sp. EG35 TaxID=3234192 RepID=UPI00345F1DE2
MPISKKRLAELAAIEDKDIDMSEIPEANEAFFKTAKLLLPPGVSKKTVTMRMDEDVLDWFQSQGKGHLTRMNAVLRAYMISQDEAR